MYYFIHLFMSVFIYVFIFVLNMIHTPLSTTSMRILHNAWYCISDEWTAAGAPCHVFVTVSNESPSTALIINYHTKDTAPAIVYYDTVSHANQNVTSYAHSVTGYQFYMDIIDEPRWVHWVELTGLTPDTTYYFAVGSVNEPSTEKKVRTAPGGDTFSFVAGVFHVCFERQLMMGGRRGYGCE